MRKGGPFRGRNLGNEWNQNKLLKLEVGKLYGMPKEKRWKFSFFTSTDFGFV
jgi:hypothetical protein